jgi:hypothetical protein
MSAGCCKRDQLRAAAWRCRAGMSGAALRPKALSLALGS